MIEDSDILVEKQVGYGTERFADFKHLVGKCTNGSKRSLYAAFVDIKSAFILYLEIS